VVFKSTDPPRAEGSEKSSWPAVGALAVPLDSAAVNATAPLKTSSAANPTDIKRIFQDTDINDLEASILIDRIWAKGFGYE
jgi:hypothetical protein